MIRLVGILVLVLAAYAYPAEALLLPPHITSPSTAHGTTGTPFSYQITATNSPTSYGASGLPSWAGINTSTGAITGTPTATGISIIGLSATNAAGTRTALLILTIAAGLSAPVVTSPSTAHGTTGTPFSYQITATNSPNSYGASGLPSWASVNTSTGTITGTPDAAATTSATISATNASGTGTGPLSITISPALPPAPFITSSNTASGTVGVPFSYSITATNSPTSYGATGLPSWASVNTSTGAITGTPDAAATTSVTISATNAGGTGMGSLSIAISSGGPPPVITSAGSAIGTVGNFMVYQITGTNSPTSYSASGLPGGLAVNTTDGIISGTPTSAGTSTPTIGATNGSGTGNATPTFSIAASGSPGPLTIASNSRYFATPNGQAVYLTGNHTWTSGQSFSAFGTFAFAPFADYLATLNVNFVRHWDVWPFNDPVNGHISPLPFNRSGTCCAQDGGNKFDLTSFNSAYFDAQKADVEYAASKGMYIMPLLLNIQDYSGGTGVWLGNYWNGSNNVNGTTTNYFAAMTNSDATTLSLQQAYIRHFVDVMASEPNVLWEIVNEPQTGYDANAVYSWQEGLIDLIHSYEASQGYMRHPVLAEYEEAHLGSSAADAVASVDGPGETVYSLGKPQITDTDHFFGIGGGTDWWWKTFMSGNNLLSMDDMHGAGLTGNADLGNTTYYFYEIQNRVALQQIRTLTPMVDMSGMVPNGSLSSTGYSLADTARHMYLVYAGGGGTITVNLSSDGGIALRARWLNTADGSISSTSNITGGSSSQSLTSPYGGNPAALIITP